MVRGLIVMGIGHFNDVYIVSNHTASLIRWCHTHRTVRATSPSSCSPEENFLPPPCPTMLALTGTLPLSVCTLSLRLFSTTLVPFEPKPCPISIFSVLCVKIYHLAIKQSSYSSLCELKSMILGKIVNQVYTVLGHTV